MDDRKPGIARRAARGAGRVVSHAGRFAKFAVVGDTREITLVYNSVRARMRRLLRPGDYARHETFSEACQRLNVSEADIARRTEELKSSARLYALIAVTALVVFGFLPWSQHRFSHGLSCILVLLMALSRYSVVRWRQAQCEHRELMPYLYYWRRWWTD